MLLQVLWRSRLAVRPNAPPGAFCCKLTLNVFWEAMMTAAIEFALFAPRNSEAALIGEFSEWEPVAMKKADDGYFRTHVDLEDGRYRYKFRVRSKSFFVEEGEWLDVVDPYATAVDDFGDGAGIIFIAGGQRRVDTYEWRHNDTHLPPDEELVIYELHVGDFSGGEVDTKPRGRYKHVCEKLDYLSELGVSAIELMPVTEFPGDESWGYNPRHFFAAESSYGSSAELKELVDTCHAHGIRVILDMVCNHAEAEMPLTKIDYQYWFHVEAQDPDHNWGPEFDYGRYDEGLKVMPARKFMGDVVRFWTTEYHIDGIRFDAVKQLGQPEFLSWLVQEAKDAAGEKPFYAIGEHIPETPEIVGPVGPMDGCWHNSFYHGITGLLAREEGKLTDVEGLLDARPRGFLGPTNLVNYLASHDHDHLMRTLADEGIHDDEAFKRAGLGAVLTVTALGIPMIWMGTEFGEYKEKALEKNKIDWQLLSNDANRQLCELWKGLIALRRQNGGFRAANFEFIHSDLQKGVLAFVRWNDEGSRVAVVANLSSTYHGDYLIEGFPENGVWREWTASYDVEVSDHRLILDLPEFEAKVLVI